MNYLELKQLILETPETAALAVENSDAPQDASEKDRLIAEFLNAPAGVKTKENWETALSLISSLGLEQAGTILSKLEAAEAQIPTLKYVNTAINSEKGVNVGDVQTHIALQMLVAQGVLTQVEADSIKALGTEPSSLALDHFNQEITPTDVSIALRNY